MRTIACFLAVLAVVATTAAAETLFQRQGHPGAANCTTRWYTQYVDHFTFGGRPGWPATYEQRVLTYSEYYRPGGPIFFYVGNEAPITAFADIAGLMWQNAEEFGAALVFAEHRFFGESFPSCRAECMGSLSTMQAMADYALLMTNLTSPTGLFPDSKGIITFGGSYGGMLSAWTRMKYPNLVTGAIACSAPIGMVSPDYDTSSYWSVVTRDASAAGGAAPSCSQNVHSAIMAAFAMLETAEGAAALSAMFGSCGNLPSGEAGKKEFGQFVQAAWDVMAMGNYPFPLDFMFGTPDHPAPAFPVRVACTNLAFDPATATNATLLEGLAAALGVYYNVTQDVKCYNMAVNPTTGSSWDYMVCSERIINELPYFHAEGWPHDMFWPQPEWTHSMYDAHCNKTWGVTPRYGWLNTTYGADNVRGASKIVFSNGLLDPWHSGGILHNVSDSVHAYIIPDGAHHLDLLFTSPADPPGLTRVRAIEKAHIADWLGVSLKH